jgi:regulator of protease activity HflC (stomatin/prohibitin superfamily)
MFRNKEGGLAIAKIVIWSVAGLVVLILFFMSFGTIDAGERGVKLQLGAVIGNPLGSGLYLKLPFIQDVVKIDVRTEKVEVEKSEAYSHDLQVVDIHSVINYNIDPAAVATVYKQYGLDFESKVLTPNLEASVKQTVAKYTAEELLSKRQEVQGEIENALKSSVPPQFIVTKYALVNEAFSPEYEKAIEEKQVAQQNAETAKNLLVKAQVDAQSRVAEADGEAKAIAIQAQAINSQGGADYIQLKAIEKWDGKLPVYQLAGTTPFINISK